MMTAARRHDSEASRGAILEAAERLFLERGFAGTSMSEIAKASGVTKSLIHHHFGSKQTLWDEVKRTRFSAYYHRQMELFAASNTLTPDLIYESMKVYFEHLQENPQMLRMMHWMNLEGDVECTEMIHELREAGIQRIAAAQKAGIVRKDVPAPIVLMIFLGIVHAWFNDPDNDPTDGKAAAAYLDNAWKIYANGVMPG